MTAGNDITTALRTATKEELLRQSNELELLRQEAADEYNRAVSARRSTTEIRGRMADLAQQAMELSVWLERLLQD